MDPAAAAAPPVPLPAGLPPPPLPPTATAPPPPPQAQAAPPPPQTTQQQHRPPPTNTVLLTHLPTALHHRQALREWLVSCGNARNVQFVPAEQIIMGMPQQDNNNDNNDNNNNDNNDNTNDKRSSNKAVAAQLLLQADHKVQPSTLCALLTMSHADAALKVVTAFRHFQQQQAEAKAKTEKKGNAETKNDNDTNENWEPKFRAFLVPTNPDIPLPPAVLDATTVQVLGEKLVSHFPTANNNKKQEHHGGGAAAAGTTTATAATTFTTTTTTTKPKSKFDVTEEDDDDEDQEDPLQSPAILQLVREFRHKLEKQQGSKAIRRQAAVRQKIQDALPVVRQRMLQEQDQQQNVPPPLPPSAGSMPLPPPPGLNLPQPPPAFATGAAVAAAGTAPRGVSNLPAWMTQEEEEPPTKRAKTAAVEAGEEQQLPDNWEALPFATTIAAHQTAALRTFVTQQIQHYLGEPEASLIDFVCQNIITNHKTPEQLLPELQDVLEEDAMAFCQAVWRKTQELECESKE